jgi:general secretion pathway protein B
MSYILDALNKSDQEQRKQQTQDLHSLQPNSEKPSGQRKYLWLVVLAILLTVNGAFIFWFTQTQLVNPGATNEQAQQSLPTTMVSPGQHRNVAETLSSNTISSSPAYTMKAESTSLAQGDILITPQGPSASANTMPRETAIIEPLRIGELPVNVQKRIPDMKFSSHIFADDRTLRMVNINGRSIREGDYVASDLKLLEISEDGVVLSFLHYTFEMSVIRDWSFD